MPQFPESALISTLPITAFWAPIQLGDFIRIEPEFGIFSATTRSEGRRGAETVAATNTSTLLRFGGGIFYTLNLQPVRSYFGARVGFPSISQSLEQAGRERQTRTQNGFTIALTLGGEYLFSDRFTLGGEVQVPFSNINAPNVNGQPEAERVNTTVLSTAVYITVRWFFN